MKQQNNIEWKEVELGDFVKLKGGFAFKSENFTEEGIPIIRISNFNNNDVDISEAVHYPRDSENKYKEFLLKDKDILIAMSGATTGKIGIINKNNLPCLLNQRVGKFEINNKNLDREYLLLFVKSTVFQNKVLSVAGGCAQPNISGKQIESLKISLPFSNGNPNLKEQERIANFLRKAEKQKEKGKKAEELLDEYLKSVFNDMFYNKEFEEIQLGNKIYFEIIMGQSPSGKSYNKIGKGMPFFQGKKEFGDKHPKVEQWTTEPSKIAEPNDILISVRAPVGSINLADIKCCIGRGLASIRCKKEIEKDYVYSFIKIKEDEIENLGNGSTFKAINSKQLLNIKIPLPPISLQQKFAKIVEHVEGLKENVKKTKQNSEELFNSLMQKAFMGEL